MTNEYQEGDLIEATHGEAVVRGRLKSWVEGHWMNLTGLPFTLPTASDGWKVAVIERAKPKVELPTEPGFYSTANGEVWELDGDGHFKSQRRSAYFDPALRTEREVLEYHAPFTRLEPRAVTAKAVLAEVGKFAWADGFTAQIEAVAAKFGVGND